MNGRRGQIGDVNGQTGTRVIRWHRGHRAAWEDRLLAAGTRPDCLSGQMFRWCECEGGSDGPGELSYALWGHGGRARRPPDGPDGLGRAPRSPRGRIWPRRPFIRTKAASNAAKAHNAASHMPRRPPRRRSNVSSHMSALAVPGARDSGLGTTRDAARRLSSCHNAQGSI